jgi:hypothetical protein
MERGHAVSIRSLDEIALENAVRHATILSTSRMIALASGLSGSLLASCIFSIILMWLRTLNERTMDVPAHRADRRQAQRIGVVRTNPSQRQGACPSLRVGAPWSEAHNHRAKQPPSQMQRRRTAWPYEVDRRRRKEDGAPSRNAGGGVVEGSINMGKTQCAVGVCAM